MTRTEAYLALNLLSQDGPVRVRRLLEYSSHQEHILKSQSAGDFPSDGFGRESTETIANWEKTVVLSRELRRIKEESLTLLTQEEIFNPKLLREIHDPPLVLYVRGQLTERRPPWHRDRRFRVAPRTMGTSGRRSWVSRSPTLATRW